MEPSTAPASEYLTLAEEGLENGETKDSKDAQPLNMQPFQCEICNKILTTKQSLNIHKETHLDPEQRRTFRCEICEATFKSQPGLNYHLETKHTPGFERKKLPCPTCGRIFKSVEGRKIHMTIQHGAGGPIFKCRECPMVFARKPHLDLHMTTHGSGLHVCTICGKPYARLKDLSRHEATCGVKELCCSVCGKQLRTEQALENHRKKCRWNSWKREPGAGEKRGRPRKSDDGGEGKVRMRRSKHDLFIGLDHLADPSALAEEAKPVAKVELKPADPTPRRFACEHCPLKFATLKALQNHGQRRHWEALGLAEPTPEKRGRKRTRPLERVPKKKGRPRKIDNCGETEELPEEVECDAAEEEAYPVKSEDTAQEEPTVDEPAENISIEHNVVYVEEKLEPIEIKEELAPDNLGVNANIKVEELECGDYEFDYFENDSAGDDGSNSEQMFEDISKDHHGTNDEFDNLADKQPALESDVSNEPQVSKELVICLEKLNYSTLVKPGSKRKRLPRTECEHCGKTFAKQYRLAQHRVRVHGSTETPTKIKLPPKSTLPPSYHCEECDKSYHFEFKLRNHKARVHGIGTEASKREPKRSCKHCEKKLSNWPALVKHLKSFHEETFDESQIVRCTPCRTNFPTEEEMKEHLCPKRADRIREPKERPFKCGLCHKTYAFLLHLEAHYTVHPGYQNFKCDQCPKTFFKESTMESHKRYMHESQPKKIRPFKSRFKNPFPRVECEHCGQTFAYQYRLAVHRVKEHGSTETPVTNRPASNVTLPLNFHCDECDKSYHLQTSLTLHKAKVHGVGEVPPQVAKLVKHSCKHCKKEFTSWGGLVYHRKCIHGESIDKSQFVQCPACRLKFASEEEMNAHICLKGIVRKRERPFKCDLCDNTYFRKVDLEYHFSAHPEYHNVKCDQCPRGFFHERELNSHKKKAHVPKEAYIECSTCNQLFKNQDSLKRHQEIHLDREYFCEQCGKKFKTRSILKSHKNHVHTNAVNQMFPCTICGKTLKGKSTLALHIRIHNNDRRFKCAFPSCDKKFFTRNCLNTHEQSHTKDYKYKCKFCEYGTVSRKMILLHEQRKHNHNRFADEKH